MAHTILFLCFCFVPYSELLGAMQFDEDTAVLDVYCSIQAPGETPIRASDV